MPRPLRPIGEELLYHVIARGNGGRRVFHKPSDYEAFLRVLSEVKQRKRFELYGYCLMSNHIHLLMGKCTVPLSRILQSLLISHTQRYHKHFGTFGHVWQGRFKSPVVQDDEHSLTLMRYIEANPLRARIVRMAHEYCWSSYRFHAFGERNDLVDRLTAFDNLSPDEAHRQRIWQEKVHLPLPQSQLHDVRRSNETGHPYGEREWIDRLCKEMQLDLTVRPRGRPKKGSERFLLGADGNPKVK